MGSAPSCPGAGCGDGEGALSEHGHAHGDDRVDAREGRRLLDQRLQERLQRTRSGPSTSTTTPSPSFSTNLPSRARREPVDERPEADALDDASDANAPSLDRLRERRGHGPKRARAPPLRQRDGAAPRMRECRRVGGACADALPRPPPYSRWRTVSDTRTPASDPGSWARTSCPSSTRSLVGDTGSSARRSATARSCSTRSPPRTSSRTAGRRSTKRRPTASSAATTSRCSAGRSAPIRGSRSSTRRASAFGAHPLRRTATPRHRGRGATPRPLALFGARSCDLHAIATQDRVFLGGRYVERDYAQRREGAFVVAVNCGVPGGTCFCASMGTGPRALGGYDLALTEITDGDHRFLVEVGSERGREILDALDAEATDEDLSAALAVTDEAARRMGRTLDTVDLPGLLARNREHPRWADVAERCLTCGTAPSARPASARRWRRSTTSPTAPPSAGGRGTRASPSTTPTSTAGASVARGSLPAVAHTQVRHVVRPVRDVRLRRVRPVHHLVPGGHRRHRGAGGDPCHGPGGGSCRRWMS